MFLFVEFSDIFVGTHLPLTPEGRRPISHNQDQIEYAAHLVFEDVDPGQQCERRSETGLTELYSTSALPVAWAVYSKFRSVPSRGRKYVLDGWPRATYVLDRYTRRLHLEHTTRTATQVAGGWFLPNFGQVIKIITPELLWLKTFFPILERFSVSQHPLWGALGWQYLGPRWYRQDTCYMCDSNAIKDSLLPQTLDSICGYLKGPRLLARVQSTLT